jgi:hypothetical protein
MNYEQQKQLEKWLELYSDDEYKPKIEFENLENKLSECKQLGAIMFLHSKLKPENKEEEFFLHGEHEELYIGSSFDIFEDFTEEDVKIAIAYGISLADDWGGGFLIYASM